MLPFFFFGLNFNTFFFLFFVFLILKLILINHFKVFQVKKLSIYFCLHLINFFVFHLINYPLLYSSYFLIYSLNWFGSFLNIEYNIGLDYLGFLFVLLTLLLIPVSLIVSWTAICYSVKLFFLLFLILEILLINVFLSLDLILFYVTFESILIPMYFLVGYWGSRQRKI